MNSSERTAGIKKTAIFSLKTNWVSGKTVYKLFSASVLWFWFLTKYTFVHKNRANHCWSAPSRKKQDQLCCWFDGTKRKNKCKSKRRLVRNWTIMAYILMNTFVMNRDVLHSFWMCWVGRQPAWKTKTIYLRICPLRGCYPQAEIPRLDSLIWSLVSLVLNSNN